MSFIRQHSSVTTLGAMFAITRAGVPIDLAKIRCNDINEGSHLCRQVLAVRIERIDAELLWQKIRQPGTNAPDFRFSSTMGVGAMSSPWPPNTAARNASGLLVSSVPDARTEHLPSGPVNNHSLPSLP